MTCNFEAQSRGPRSRCVHFTSTVTRRGATLAAGSVRPTLPGRKFHPLGFCAEFCVGSATSSTPLSQSFLAYRIGHAMRGRGWRERRAAHFRRVDRQAKWARAGSGGKHAPQLHLFGAVSRRACPEPRARDTARPSRPGQGRVVHAARSSSSWPTRAGLGRGGGRGPRPKSASTRAMPSGLLAILTKRIPPRQRGHVMMSTANTL